MIWNWNYTAKCGNLVGVTGGSSPITVTGLTNGASYTCKVKTTSTFGVAADRKLTHL